MYYDRLRCRVNTIAKARQDAHKPRINVVDCIAPCYITLHNDVKTGQYTTFHLPGGRGSAKSSFVSLEIVDGMMDDPTANAIVFRRTAATMRESVFSQIAWAIDALGVTHLWRGNVSPMTYTYIPTGQQITFRGLDDAAKLKSIRPRHGKFKYVWFEEFAELNGPNQVRSVLQSVIRGGDDFRIFNSFNPPMSLNSWANKYILTQDNRATVFHSNYTMIPPEWLGESFLLEAERVKEVNERVYRHEYLGEAVGTGGEVFPNIEIREITDDEIKQMQYIYQGLDWGFSIDPLAFVRVSYNSKTQTVFLLDEIVKRGCSNTEIVSLIKEKGYDKSIEDRGFYSLTEGKYISGGKQLVICDSEDPKSIADIQKQGIKAIPCKKYPGSVNYGIRWLQSKKIVIDPKRTPNGLKEFTEYEYETTKDGEFLASVPDKNNHLIDGVRYSLDQIINSAKYSA